ATWILEDDVGRSERGRVDRRGYELTADASAEHHLDRLGGRIRSVRDGKDGRAGNGNRGPNRLGEADGEHPATEGGGDQHIKAGGLTWQSVLRIGSRQSRFRIDVTQGQGETSYGGIRQEAAVDNRAVVGLAGEIAPGRTLIIGAVDAAVAADVKHG